MIMERRVNQQAESREWRHLYSQSPDSQRDAGPVISSHWIGTSGLSRRFQTLASSLGKNKTKSNNMKNPTHIRVWIRLPSSTKYISTQLPKKRKHYCQSLLPWRNPNGSFVCWAKCITEWITEYVRHGYRKAGKGQTCAVVKWVQNIENQNCEAPE